MRRWSWPGAGGKPVYNFRSDGREFPSGRCLIVADGFYEFTASVRPEAEAQGPLAVHVCDGGMLGIAGLTRTVPDIGEAFTMLTTEPGEDVAPYHSRQVAVVPQDDWRAWLDGSAPAADLLKPLPAGSLAVSLAPRETAGPALV